MTIKMQSSRPCMLRAPVRQVTCCLLVPLRGPAPLNRHHSRPMTSVLASRTRDKSYQNNLPQQQLPQLQQQRHSLRCVPFLQQQDQQQQQQRRVQARALTVDVLLGGLTGMPAWILVAMLLVGVLLGLMLSKLATNYLRKEADPYWATLENAELRTKVEELQQLVLKVQPLAYKSMRLRFTKGINKAVILGMVDQMLANKEVNIWWLPDSIERVFYFNMMTLMLSVLDEVVDGMSISLAGHNVRLELTHLDVAPDGAAATKQSLKTEAELKRALEPPKTYGHSSSSSSSSS